MRNVKVKVAVMFFLIWTSCKTDDSVINPLIGTWQYSYEEHTECDDPVDNLRYDYPCDNMDCFKITFAEDFTLTAETLVGGILNKVDGTYSLEGSMVTICTSGCDEPVTFSAGSDMLSLIHEDNAGCTVTRVLTKP